MFTWIQEFLLISICAICYVVAANDNPIVFPGTSNGGPIEPGTSDGGPIEPGTSNGPMELPDNLDELDVSELDRLNGVNTIEDFANLFGLTLPEENITISTRISGEPNAIKYKSAGCVPETKVVELDLPKEGVYFPKCIRIERCGGCCHHPYFSCQSINTEIVKVKVIKANRATNSVNRRGSRNTPRGTRSRPSRPRRDSTSSYHIVPVEKHLKCSCECKVMEKDCNLNIHTYSRGECACKCKNQSEKELCGKSSMKLWDNKTCTCECRNKQECGTGETFSNDTCRCEYSN